MKAIPERCAEVCLPYFREIAATMLTEDPQPEIDWLPEPDLTNPFPPAFTFPCPHQVSWTAQPTRAQIQAWETTYPLQAEVFPMPFVCLVTAESESPGCDHEIPPDLFPGEPLEVPLAQMLEHIHKGHGAPYWAAMHHLVANYPGLNNYCGSEARIAAHAPKTPAD